MGGPQTAFMALEVVVDSNPGRKADRWFLPGPSSAHQDCSIEETMPHAV
jgi:hypothetical protein